MDDRDINAGEKGWGWVKKGIPVRAEIGPRDMANDAVFMARRDTGEKKGVGKSEFVEGIADLLESISRTCCSVRSTSARRTRRKSTPSMNLRLFSPRKTRIGRRRMAGLP